MKKFLIDTYKIFLLQTSKVIWDIVGWTFLTWFFFYINEDSMCSIVFAFVQFAVIWIVVRLYWQRGKNHLEEIESLRPVSPFAPGAGNLLVISFFFLLIYVVTGLLAYNLRLARFVLWLNDYLNLGINLNKPPHSFYIKEIARIRPSFLLAQKEAIICGMTIFWFYAISIAFAMKLKLLLRTIFFIILFIVLIFLFTRYGFLCSELVRLSDLKKISVLYILCIPMLIYIIIPKRINFK